MTGEELLSLFRQTGVLMEGHFRLTSGRHSPVFLQCARLLQYPFYAEQVSRTLAGMFTGESIDVVVGPAVGGIILAYEIARAKGARAVFAEREEGKMTLRRGFTINAGERALVVEDAVTTGGSVNEVMELVTLNGGRVVGIGMLVDRSGGRVDFGVPARALVTLEIPSFSPAECPQCRDGVPLVTPKSGRA